MSVCAAIKPNGERCNAGAMQGSDYCYNHSPDLAAERKRNASKGGKRGGRGRLSAELARLQKRLEELAEQVLRGEVERSLAHTTGVLLNHARGCIKDGLDARDKEEFEERLAELERSMEAAKPGRRYST